MLKSKPSITATLDRPAQARGLLLLVLVLSVLAILGGTIWRNLIRFDQIQGYVSYSHQVQNVGLNLQKALMDSLSGLDLPESRQYEINPKIDELQRSENHLAPETPERLKRVQAALFESQSKPIKLGRQDLLEALRIMHLVQDSETEQRETVLESISRDTLTELELATGVLVSILMLTWFFLRSRILAPLQDLKHLLLNLAQEDFVPIDTSHLDPLLLPVFNSYNVMISHLEMLEEAKRSHAKSLEEEVRAATHALLEQQYSLAQAERLAAVGELAASLAHELRNPLAGIQMACANLRGEVKDPDQAERLDLVGSELKRMARLLNSLLDQSRQTPPPAREINLAGVVKELVTLTRYQIPEQISLQMDIAPDISCWAPESNLRQALLNLMLNSAQSLGEKAGFIIIKAQKTANGLIITVEDNGTGFPASMLETGIRTFNTGRAGGTGLGLAVVQRFVHDMNGQIEIANRSKGGARVSLTLADRNKQT
ncbi:HAMP domain-containing sensor histidine kinase [Candidatus Methylospira mobilis]|uniref:sensor histidine kinase n=1 Tax=Candidatus Methylospira mobilis TaxID=1808979 RepID=UPI001884A0AD|nr:HAMP domain-containing sensor histidine kinase [Candidatus Methylospira mobilis]WNV05334.1 HAMP domain-containing sensor histidine kinase [Candidatus Methylospira mobilis]